MVNDIHLLNGIKEGLGLQGMGAAKRTYTKSGKTRNARVPKIKTMDGAGFLDFIKKVISVPAKLVSMPLQMFGLGKGGERVEIYVSPKFRELTAAGMSAAGMSAAGKKRGRKAAGISAAGMSAAGLSAAGLSAAGKPKRKYVKKGGNVSMEGNASRFEEPLGSGMSGKPKRKYVKKNGAGFLDLVSKVANFSPFTNTTSGNPLSKFFGDENVRKVAVDVASKVLGLGKGKKVKATKAKKAPSKKVSERAKLVKQVMAEHGLSMIHASKYIKENGLY